WRFIEKPFRNTAIIPEKKSVTILVVWSIALLFYGFILHKTYGFQNNFKKFSYEGNPQAYVDQAYKYQKKETGSILVIGDSFGRDLINSLESMGIDDIKYYYRDCDAKEIFEKNQALNADVKNANIVIVSQLWADPDRNYKNELASLDNCFSELKKLNVNSYILGTKNFGYNNNFVRLLPEDLVND